MSYAHLFKPYAAMPGQEEKYSVTLLIPKTDTATKARIDAAIEAADVVLMDDDPLKISKAIGISRKCLGIVYQNIVFALVIKFGCLALGAVGVANMWFAIFADVGVMIIAVLNAIRALRVQNFIKVTVRNSLLFTGDKNVYCIRKRFLRSCYIEQLQLPYKMS